jgi:hypothetical protein
MRGLSARNGNSETPTGRVTSEENARKKGDFWVEDRIYDALRNASSKEPYTAIKYTDFTLPPYDSLSIMMILGALKIVVAFFLRGGRLLQLVLLVG